MCDPLSIGLLIAGTAASSYGQNQQQNAIRSVREAERARQARIAQEADAAFARSKAIYEPGKFQTDMASNKTKRETEYKSQNMSAPRANAMLSPSGASGNKVVSDYNARKLAEADQQSNAMGAARADLGSFGDTMFADDLQHNRVRNDIDQAANFARGSAGVLSSELDAAQYKGSKMRALGTLISMLGQGAALRAGGAAIGKVPTGVTGGIFSPVGKPIMQPMLSPSGPSWLNALQLENV